MHRCQGFGSAGSRGSSMEYLKLLEGEPGDDIFQGIDMSWSRLEGGAEIGRLVEHVINNYDLTDPAASIPGLLQVYQQIEALPDGFWKKKKLKETALLIRWCMGLYLERSEEHTSEIQSLMRISYAVFFLKKKRTENKTHR